MWDGIAWGARSIGTPGCWSGRGADGFFAAAFTGSNCARNWLEGTIDGARFREGVAAPAVMGNDPAILEYCLGKVGRWRRVWFAKNEELAGTCLEANQNVLRLGRRLWDICVNFEFVACASHGLLPSQGSPSITFATAPGDLWIRDLAPEKTNGYRMEDVLYLETCILNELCANGEEMFALKPGETFVCATDEARFRAFGQLMATLER